MNDHYDIILVGSGMGALTAASLMAQLRDKRVLVLEKHNRPGGYTHDFKRGRYHFDTGLHYLGKMQEGSMTRRMIDLITGGKVEWVPMPETGAGACKSANFEIHTTNSSSFILKVLSLHVPVNAAKRNKTRIAYWPVPKRENYKKC
jgi:phytoene dehydrogenase-like protein